MMLKLAHDPAANLLDDRSDVLVCPVNCMPGVLGAGLAKQFAARWPGLIEVHRVACRTGHLEPGRVWFAYLDLLKPTDHPVIGLFATKGDWRRQSRLPWIASGLDATAAFLTDQAASLRSIAIPALGCGLGGLAWSEVFPLLESFADRLPDCRITVYLPKWIE